MNKYNVRTPANPKVIALQNEKVKLIQRVIKMIEAKYYKKLKEIKNAK
jgi:hypothetical protein